jgi:hypothetical protein
VLRRPRPNRVDVNRRYARRRLDGEPAEPVDAFDDAVSGPSQPRRMQNCGEPEGFKSASSLAQWPWEKMSGLPRCMVQAYRYPVAAFGISCEAWGSVLDESANRPRQILGRWYRPMGSMRGHIHWARESDCRLSVTAALTAAGAMVLMSSIVACGNGVSSELNTMPPTMSTSNVPQAHSGNGESPALNTPAQSGAASNTPSMGGDVSFPAPSASSRRSATPRSNGFAGPPAPTASTSPTSSSSPTPGSARNPSPSCSNTPSASPTTTSPATTPPPTSPNC